MRRAVALAVVLTSCGGAKGAGADRCVDAARSGPPEADAECPVGTSRQVAIERLGARVVPTATGAGAPLAAVATSLWCADEAGVANGPYLGLDGRRRVVRSGHHAAGEPDGEWIAWSPGGAPQAVTIYARGRLQSERRCR